MRYVCIYKLEGKDFKYKKWIFEMRNEKSTPALLSFFGCYAYANPTVFNDVQE